MSKPSSAGIALSRRTLLAASLPAMTAIAWPVDAAVPVGCGTLPCPFGPIRTLGAARSALQDMLTLNLLPFWRRVVDESAGEGYDLQHDAFGRYLGPANRALVTQARVLWFFAHLMRHGRAGSGDAARAERGFSILTQRFLDPVHGGFYWELDKSSYAPTKSGKQLYGQVFALFALGEYALATGSAEAASAAGAAWQAISGPLWQADADNFIEFRLRDWTAPPAGTKDLQGLPAGTRTHNTRIHLLEALTTYHELDPGPSVTARLSRVVDLTEAALVTTPQRFFREVDGQPADRRSYGHDTETIHLLLRARRRLGRCDAMPSFYPGVVTDALAAGADPQRGGIYLGGPAGGPPDQLARKDWVQAETLLALAELYRHGRASLRRDQLFRLLTWIGRWQVDWANGSWHDTIGPTLAPSGRKAGPWGGPYHTGRAILGTLRILDAVQSGLPKGGCTFL